jgi:threonine aldolase
MTTAASEASMDAVVSDELKPAEVRELMRSCSRFLNAGGYLCAADYLREIPNDAEPDFYGAGGVVEELEREVAVILGKQAAAFMPTGVMAQQIALRIHADRRGRRGVVFHPQCHIDTKELRAYERLHGLEGHPVGEPNRLLALSDLSAHRWFGEPSGELPAVLVLELPQRDIGGQLPPWEELVAQVEWARSRGAAVHLDGARLWGCGSFYDRPFDRIAELFDTVYVSFYKELAGLAGAALAGEDDVFAEAREWRRRHGGTLAGLWPNAASGLAGLRGRLPEIAACQEHALAIAAALRDLDGVDVLPDPPHTPMFHVLFHRDADGLSKAAVRLARVEGIWTFHRAAGTDVPGVQRWEVAVGRATLEWQPSEFRSVVERLLTD